MYECKYTGKKGLRLNNDLKFLLLYVEMFTLQVNGQIKLRLYFCIKKHDLPTLYIFTLANDFIINP